MSKHLIILLHLPAPSRFPLSPRFSLFSTFFFTAGLCLIYLCIYLCELPVEEAAVMLLVRCLNSFFIPT